MDTADSGAADASQPKASPSEERVHQRHAGPAADRQLETDSALRTALLPSISTPV